MAIGTRAKHDLQPGDATRLARPRSLDSEAAPTQSQLLQRTYGNRATASAAGDPNAKNAPGRRVATPPIVQTSLLLGEIDTPAEREANAVAAAFGNINAAAQPNAEEPSTPAPQVQRAASASALGGGAPVDSQIAERIESARGSGNRLDPNLQRTMEQHIGADLGGVRVHTGDEANTLNRSLQSRAFTTGSDLFFRNGEYQPNSESGQRLLAHELTHVAQQGAAPRTNSVQRKGIIQRAVGFEFEAGLWTLHKLNAPLTKRQKSGKDQVPKTQLEDMGIPKGEPLYKGTDWAFTADHSDDMHVEFVTKAPGFQEGKDGRKKLVSSMNDMKKFGDKMIDAKSKAKVNVEGGGMSVPLSELAWRASSKILMTPRSYLEAEPQTTAGIRLDQLATLMDRFTKQNYTEETAEQSKARKMGNSLLWGKQPRDQVTVSESPDEVNAAWGRVQTKYSGVNHPKHGKLTDMALSKEAIGLMSIMRSYLVTAAGGIAYAKSLAPMMARTNMVKMFNYLPDTEVDLFTDFPGLFTELVLEASGMPGTGDDPVMSGKTTYISKDHLDVLQQLTRKIWIEGITQGKDYLSEKDFPDQDVGQLLFGLGGLEEKTDVVGEKGDQYNAPIFEFRRMQGAMPHYKWPSLALDIFEYISATNKGEDPVFEGARAIAAQKETGKIK